MDDKNKMKELADKLRLFMFGQVSPTYNKIITDVFVVPDMWVLAKLVYKERLHYSGFPFLPSDTLTLVLAFNDNSLKAVKDVVMEDYQSFPKGEEILELVRNLPDMTDPTQELEREKQKSQ